MGIKGEIPQSYSIGQSVSGRVDRVFPFGVFVRLAGDTRAYIRRRELSLEGDVDPRELFIEGQEIEAVVLQLPAPGRSMELSRRALLHDPWKEFAEKFRKGDVVIATVRDLTPDGVFARIAAGVDGFIPLEELAPWKVERPEDVVWVGDRLEAEIIQIDQTRREVRLSIRRRLERLSRVEAIMERLRQRTETQAAAGVPHEDQEQTPEPTEDWTEEIEGSGPVLVMDDRDDVREPLVKWLTLQGCPAQGAKTVSEGLNLCEKQRYRLILADLELETENGLSLIRTLRNRGDATAVAVMSSPEWIEEHFGEIQALGVTAVFPKSLFKNRITWRVARAKFC
jgi:predicted RNA-binding protein with RPS1 domain/CheY-like chemotaxis protein